MLNLHASLCKHIPDFTTSGLKTLSFQQWLCESHQSADEKLLMVDKLQKELLAAKEMLSAKTYQLAQTEAQIQSLQQALKEKTEELQLLKQSTKVRYFRTLNQTKQTTSAYCCLAVWPTITYILYIFFEIILLWDIYQWQEVILA